MSVRFISAALAAAVVISTPAMAQTVEDRAAARALLAKHAGSVVTIRATVKLRGLPGPGQGEEMEDTVQSDAVVLDATGLTVTSLSQLDPSDMLKQVFSGMPGAPPMELTVEQSNIRLRLENGTEVPARIVLRDKDLDLIFLRPTTAPASPMAFIDTTAPAKTQPADLVMVLHRFGEMTGWKAGVSFGYVQAVVDKPRTLYVVSTAEGMGAPVFDATGRFLGLMVMRTQAGGRASMFSMMQEGPGIMPVVLPVEEIMELAKQAK